MPEALVTLTAGQQAQADGILVQFENKAWHRRVRHAELVPVGCARRPVIAQVCQQPVAEFADGQRWPLGPVMQQVVRWGIAHDVKRLADERQRRGTPKELGLIERAIVAVGKPDTVGEEELGISRFKSGRQFRQLTVKGQAGAIGLEFQARLMPPARQPLQ